MVELTIYVHYVWHYESIIGVPFEKLLTTSTLILMR
jgi:hypothetical protein